MPGNPVLIALVMVGGVLRPRRWPEVATILAALVVTPWLTVPALVIAARSRRVDDGFARVAFLQGVAAELRAGASVRSALAAASARTDTLDLAMVARLAEAGAPLSDVADRLESQFDDVGALVASAVDVGARSGGQMAPVFSTLASIATDRLELDREIRTSTAAVRASAYVVGGLPLLALAFGGLSGTLRQSLESGPAGVTLVGVGLALLVAGIGSMAMVARSP